VGKMAVDIRLRWGELIDERLHVTLMEAEKFCCGEGDWGRI